MNLAEDKINKRNISEKKETLTIRKMGEKKKIPPRKNETDRSHQNLDD